MPLKRFRIASVLVFIGIVVSLCAGKNSAAQETVTILKNEATTVFPRLIDFRLSAHAEEEIVAAEVEYGSLALTCGPVATVGRPDFVPSTEVDLNWRWQVVDGEILPPGAQIWWRWRLITAGGETIVTPDQHQPFNDRWFVWRSIERENLRVHWYRGEQALAEEILAVGLDILNQMAEETGQRLTEPIDIYLYEDPASLRASVPGAPGWIGGIAFPEHSIVLLLATSDYVTESARILRHELGHLVFTRLTFHCTTRPPTWLAEGLAMIAEGNDDGLYADELTVAIEDGRLLSLAQLEGSFSVHDRTAGLAYAQSYSIVRFLSEGYGQEKLASLIASLGAGEPFDSALITVYDMDGAQLEDEWRSAVGALPRRIETTAEAGAEDEAGSGQPAVVPTFSLPKQELSTTTPVMISTASPAPLLATRTITLRQSESTVLSATPASIPGVNGLDTNSESEEVLWRYWPIFLAAFLIFGLFLILLRLLRRSSQAG